jgi:hypothetical protein
MWCTEEEKLLFAKYPEVAGHDTKAGVCSLAAPFYYNIGMRENFHTYVIFRGLVANETLGMFMFISHTAWVYLHGKARLSASGASGDAGSADADSSFEEGFFHGPSCSETDSQTSYSSGAFR